jgi:hypothetical protein
VQSVGQLSAALTHKTAEVASLEDRLEAAQKVSEH